MNSSSRKATVSLAVAREEHPWSSEPAEPIITTAILGDVLASEANLLQDLLSILRSQRKALRSGDLSAIEDCAFATRRVLHTLSEARRRRDTIYKLLGVPRDAGAGALAQNLGTALPRELRIALDRLITAANALAREVELNREALQVELARDESAADPVVSST